MECEAPNNRLDKFMGLLAIEDIEDCEQDISQYSLDNDKILLRVGICLFVSLFV